MILVSSCSCLCPIYWSQVWSWEWRCSWSSADRRCSIYIWVINSLISYNGVAYIRDLTVTFTVGTSQYITLSQRNPQLHSKHEFFNDVQSVGVVTMSSTWWTGVKEISLQWTGTHQGHVMYMDSRATFQYTIRYVIIRSHEVLKLRDWQFKISHHFEIWQAHQQQCLRWLSNFRAIRLF